MRKIIMIILFVLIGIACGIIGHTTVKKYFYKNYINKEINAQIVYNEFLSGNPHIIENTTSVITTNPITEISLNTTTIPTTRTTITTTNLITTTKEIIENQEENTVIEEVLDNGEKILDDMTLTELTEKLNKSLNSTLSNTGHYFANYYKETGLDPYLAVAIVLHETGCKWTCSKLVRECNNIGGMKGKPSCNGGSYMKYETLEDGINGYLDMLYNNYYSKGLNTPELINPKYAASTTWSEKINNYMVEIKSK